VLITLHAGSGKTGFCDRVHKRLHLAVGDPGIIDVFDTRSMARLGTVATEKGAHTFALAPAGDRIYAFSPQSDRAGIYETGHM